MKTILEKSSLTQPSPYTENSDPVFLKRFMKLTRKRLGFLLNFGEAFMKDGITRAANGFPEF